MRGHWFGWLAGSQSMDTIKANPLPDLDTQSKVIGDKHYYLATDQANVYQVEDLLVSFQGQLQWTDPELQKLADSTGPASALATAFRQHQQNFLRYIRGSFAIAILRPKDEYGLLAIDRLGVQRLAYSTIDGLAFSNSISTLRRGMGRQLSLSSQALYNYMYFHMIPSPETIYEQVHKLEPGHYLEFSKGEAKKHLYWTPDFGKSENTNLTQQSDRLREILHRAVGKHAQAGTGAFLSGGLDSSSVSGFLSQHLEKPKTFSIGFNAKGYDETEYARITANHFGTDHHEYYVTPKDVADIVPQIAKAFDEPFGNSSAIPVYYCAKLARNEGCTTLLAGDGGDEFFAGNERYVKQKLFETYAASPNWLQNLNRTIFSGATCQLPILKKGCSFVRQTDTPLPDRLEEYNFLNRNNPVDVFSSDFLQSIRTDAPISHLRGVYNTPQDADYLDKMLYLDWKRTLADNDLRKVNEMCRFAGIDVRYPMMDEELVDFSCSLPSSVKIKHLKIRHFYKTAVKGFLPEQIINKPKHGFGLPFGVWLNDYEPLRALAHDSLNSLKSRQYFNPDFIDSALHMHRTVHASYYGELIWVMMMLELWLDSHLEA